MELQRNFKDGFVGKRIIQPVMRFLKAGMSPKELALAFSLGMVVGTIPLVGSTTLICMLLAFALRLNLAVLQLANYLVFPLQLILFIPFFKMGAYFVAPLQIPFSVNQISEMMQKDLIGTLQQFWFANLQALLVWFVLALPVYLLLYFSLYMVFKRVSSSFKKQA